MLRADLAMSMAIAWRQCLQNLLRKVHIVHEKATKFCEISTLLLTSTYPIISCRFNNIFLIACCFLARRPLAEQVELLRTKITSPKMG